MADDKYFIVVFQDYTGTAERASIKIDDYNPKESYKDNVIDHLYECSEEGGVWINNKKLIPFHRVLGVEIPEIKNDNSKIGQNHKRKQRNNRNKHENRVAENNGGIKGFKRNRGKFKGIKEETVVDASADNRPKDTKQEDKSNQPNSPVS